MSSSTERALIEQVLARHQRIGEARDEIKALFAEAKKSGSDVAQLRLVVKALKKGVVAMESEASRAKLLIDELGLNDLKISGQDDEEA